MASPLAGLSPPPAAQEAMGWSVGGRYLKEHFIDMHHQSTCTSLAKLATWAPGRGGQLVIRPPRKLIQYGPRGWLMLESLALVKVYTKNIESLNTLYAYLAAGSEASPFSNTNSSPPS